MSVRSDMDFCCCYTKFKTPIGNFGIFNIRCNLCQVLQAYL